MTFLLRLGRSAAFQFCKIQPFSCSFSSKGISTSPLISPYQLQSRLKSDKNLKIIDVRDEKSFVEGHIPSAFNIEKLFTYAIEDSSPKTMTTMQTDFGNLLSDCGINRDHSIVTYEEAMDTNYGAGCRVYFILKYLGVQNVSVLHGGFAAWKNMGYSSASGTESSVEKSKFEPEINLDLMADRDDILRALDDPDTVIEDSRDDDEWRGVASSPYGVDVEYCPRKGRIPGAIRIPWLDVMEPKPHGVVLFKDPKKIKHICVSAGIKDLDTPIITYCLTGARASNTQIAMQLAGYRNVKNYFASWYAWSRDPELPIDSAILEDM